MARPATLPVTANAHETFAAGANDCGITKVMINETEGEWIDVRRTEIFISGYQTLERANSAGTGFDHSWLRQTFWTAADVAIISFAELSWYRFVFKPYWLKYFANSKRRREEEGKYKR
jgi:hypothetical protein